MQPIDFPERNLIIAENQPEYIPIPANLARDGVATFCWELSDEELKVLAETKKLWHQVLTFNRPLQPQMLMVEKPVLL